MSYFVCFFCVFLKLLSKCDNNTAVLLIWGADYLFLPASVWIHQVKWKKRHDGRPKTKVSYK